MKIALTLLCGLTLFAQIANASVADPHDATTVSAKDAYGCVGEQGYSWCVKLKQCVRPSKILIENNLELTAENFHEFCQTQHKE
ncbi:hypothetical protein [Deefgea rivuli]|uniref:hypothetical protein n=1 Tax=Deefgea rivuli TaxID=400948 RepID=UPI00055AF6A9|nr:hypothetical protein [Deefgea rivuli]